MTQGMDEVTPPDTTVQDWMLICQNQVQFAGDDDSPVEDVDWLLAAQEYGDAQLHEMPSFIAQQRQYHVSQPHVTTADPGKLQGKLLETYRTVLGHFQQAGEGQKPLRMIVSGTAGTGKSYLIQCLQQLLGDKIRVAAPTGGAAFNVHGHTLHSLLSITVRGEFKELQGQRLLTMQESLAGVDYLIVDEHSMVGRKLFGMVDRRL